MRALRRNRQTFWYSLYEGMTMLQVDGLYTGEKGKTYSDPVMYKANISAAQGDVEARQFGENISYDRVICMDLTAPPIDEYTRLWVDREPYDGNGNLTAHDYIVRKVARSLNSVNVAISRVDVSEEDH